MSAALEILSSTLRNFLYAAFLGAVIIGVLFLGFYAYLLVYPPCSGGGPNYGALTVIIPTGLVGGILVWNMIRLVGRFLLGPWTPKSSPQDNQRKALVMYIQESERYGLPKKEIVERLKSQGWTEIQIAGAYRQT